MAARAFSTTFWFVDAILRIPVPNDVRQLSRFVSTAVYYLKFVLSFAELCEPLRQLLKSNAVWNWSSQCLHNFDEMKRRISEPPILSYFDVELPTIVTCDVSSFAISATISVIKMANVQLLSLQGRLACL